MRRAAPAALAAALAVALPGCAGSGTGSKAPTTTLRVYVSVPLHGARAAEGRAVEDGAKLALAQSGGVAGDLKIEALYLDDTQGGRWSLARTADNARAAAEDVTAIGYIGELDSGATRASLPLTNQAQMVQISPGSTAVDLTRSAPGTPGPKVFRPSDQRNFARVVPDDDVQARAAAIWAKKLGFDQASAQRDASQFSRVTTQAFSGAATQLGIPTTVSTIRPLPARPVGSIVPNRRRALIYYGGLPSAPALRTLGTEMVGLPHGSLIGSDALLEPAFLRRAASFEGKVHLTSPYIDPSRLPPRGQRFVAQYRRRFGRAPEPAAAYGYESMALLLDAIRRAGSNGDDRSSVIDQVLSTRDRHSVLGTYSIDSNGDTTLRSISGYTVKNGRPAFATELTAPR